MIVDVLRMQAVVFWSEWNKLNIVEPIGHNHQYTNSLQMDHTLLIQHSHPTITDLIAIDS